MKKYNRALDFTALALNELSKGKPTLAARLLAKAVASPDCKSAIGILEASNRAAFAVTAGRRVRASDDMDMDDDMEGNPLDEVEGGMDDEDMDMGDDMGDDTATMASVLSSMTRRTRRR